MSGPCEGGAEIAVSNRGKLSFGFAARKGNRECRPNKSIAEESSTLKDLDGRLRRFKASWYFIDKFSRLQDTWT